MESELKSSFKTYDKTSSDYGEGTSMNDSYSKYMKWFDIPFNPLIILYLVYWILLLTTKIKDYFISNILTILTAFLINYAIKII